MILKISRKNIENSEGVGKNVKSIFAKSRTEILAILWFFWRFLWHKMAKLDAIQRGSGGSAPVEGLRGLSPPDFCCCKIGGSKGDFGNREPTNTLQSICS